MKTLAVWYRSFRKVLLITIETVCALVVLAILTMLSGELFSRTFLGTSNSVLGEQPSYILVYIPFLYVGLAFARHKHITADLVSAFVKEGTIMRVIRVLVGAFIIYAAGMMLYAALLLGAQDIGSQAKTYTDVPVAQWIYSISFPAGMFILMFFAIEKFIIDLVSLITGKSQSHQEGTGHN